MERKKQCIIPIVFLIVVVIGSLFLAVTLKKERLYKEEQTKDLIYNLSDNTNNLFTSTISKYKEINDKVSALAQNEISLQNDLKEQGVLIESLYKSKNEIYNLVNTYDCVSIQNNESLQMICK